MTTKQRELHLHKVSSAPVVELLDELDHDGPSPSQSSLTDYSPLPVSPEQANLGYIPLETVRSIWSKAKVLLTNTWSCSDRTSFAEFGPPDCCCFK